MGGGWGGCRSKGLRNPIVFVQTLPRHRLSLLSHGGATYHTWRRRRLCRASPLLPASDTPCKNEATSGNSREGSRPPPARGAGVRSSAFARHAGRGGDLSFGIFLFPSTRFPTSHLLPTLLPSHLHSIPYHLMCPTTAFLQALPKVRSPSHHRSCRRGG